MTFLDNLKINSKYHFYMIGFCYLVLWFIYYKNFYHGSHGAPPVEDHSSNSDEPVSYTNQINFYIVSNEQWIVSCVYFLLGLIYIHHAFSSKEE